MVQPATGHPFCCWVQHQVFLLADQAQSKLASSWSQSNELCRAVAWLFGLPVTPIGASAVAAGNAAVDRLHPLLVAVQQYSFCFVDHCVCQLTKPTSQSNWGGVVEPDRNQNTTRAITNKMLANPQLVTEQGMKLGGSASCPLSNGL